MQGIEKARPGGLRTGRGAAEPRGELLPCLGVGEDGGRGNGASRGLNLSRRGIEANNRGLASCPIFCHEKQPPAVNGGKRLEVGQQFGPISGRTNDEGFA